MSNRFAWAWKLASSRIPVVLIYLGYLEADEMADIGTPFATHEHWERLVTDHGGGVVPAACWGRQWMIDGQAFVPLIRSLKVPLAAV